MTQQVRRGLGERGGTLQAFQRRGFGRAVPVAALDFRAQQIAVAIDGELQYDDGTQQGLRPLRVDMSGVDL